MNLRVLMLLSVLLFVLCGCKTGKSLERKPAAPRREKTRSVDGRQPMSTGDPLFDTVFRKSRKAADEGGFASSELSEQERALYNQNRAIRASDDPVVRSLRERHKDLKKERSDWVYGVDKNLW